MRCVCMLRLYGMQITVRFVEVIHQAVRLNVHGEWDVDLWHGWPGLAHSVSSLFNSDEESNDNSRDQRQLLLACAADDGLPIVQSLVESGCDVCCQDAWQRTPLMIAVRARQLD